MKFLVWIDRQPAIGGRYVRAPRVRLFTADGIELTDVFALTMHHGGAPEVDGEIVDYELAMQPGGQRMTVEFANVEVERVETLPKPPRIVPRVLPRAGTPAPRITLPKKGPRK